MTEPRVISEPGVYTVAPEVYHAQTGSLSHSGAKLLLPPSCPAKFKHWLTAGSEHKPEYDFGHAYHTRVLGIGERVDVIDEKAWTSKVAQEARKAAYVAGRTPILRKDAGTIEAMAEVLHGHSYARELLTVAGRAEQSLFWADFATGVTRRARLDYLHDSHELVIDIKTCVSAEPGAISRAMWSNGYYMQAAWYQDAVAGSHEEYWPWPEFAFLFQEKTPPYVVTVVTPDEEMLAIGRARNRQAIELYRQCVTFDHWPGYVEGPVTVGLPRYAMRELEVSAAEGVDR